MYNLDTIDKILDQKLDKAGSDYFSLPAKMIEFREATYDLILESYTYFEATQIISDEIKTLIKKVKKPIIKMGFVPDDEFVIENDNFISQSGWYVPQPSRYLHLINLIPYYRIDSSKVLQSNVKKIEIIKQSQENIYKRSPYKSATEEYPHVFREGDIFRLEFGNSNKDYKRASVTYIEHPRFANENNASHLDPNSTVPAVNLPVEVVKKIINRASDSLLHITADPNADKKYNFNRTFGKRNM